MHLPLPVHFAEAGLGSCLQRDFRPEPSRHAVPHLHHPQTPRDNLATPANHLMPMLRI